MSYTMTHIFIAENVAKHIKGISDFSTYIVGSIAPDAVHARADYDPTQKEKSHLFTEGLRWGHVETASQVDAWVNNIRDYYHAHKGKVDYDFLVGYMVHLFSDVYSSVHFYGPIVLAVGADFEKMRERFVKENFAYNYYLYREYTRDKDLRAILNAGKSVTLDGVIEKEDIEKRIRLLFEKEFTEKDISDMYSFAICTHEVMKQLIDGSTELVLEELKKLDRELYESNT